MKKHVITCLLTMIIVLAAFGQPKTVNILAVNDMHANIDLFPQFAAIADSLRAIDPDLLVLSAGDNRTGNPLNDMYTPSSYPMVALMNQVGFDGSTLGNHDFDAQSLPALIGLSNFRYICANITAPDTMGINTVPYKVFCPNGLKVGVIGAVQVNAKGRPDTHPDNVKGIKFKPASEVVPEYEWLSRECDITILLSHIGYEADVEMAKACPWLDLIIGGHTHSQLASGENTDDVLITQNKNKLRHATHITLTVEDGRVTSKKAEYINVAKFPKKNKVVDGIVHFISDNPQFKEVLAEAETPFDNIEELGLMVCDAFREEGNADIGIENRGGIRMESHPTGDITILDVLEIDPFYNMAVEMTLTGQQILELLKSYSRGSLDHFPHVSGMFCKVTTCKNDPMKIKEVKLFTTDGRKFDLKRSYRVITNSYVVATCTAIPKGVAHTTNIETSDMIMRFLKKKGKVNYQGAKYLRIKQE